MTTRTTIEVQAMLDGEKFERARARGIPYAGASRVVYTSTYELGPSESDRYTALENAAIESGHEWEAVVDVMYVAGGSAKPVWRPGLGNDRLQGILNKMQLLEGGVFALKVLNSA